MSRAWSVSALSLLAPVLAVVAPVQGGAARAESPRFAVSLDLGGGDNVAYDDGGAAAIGLGLDLRTEVVSIGLLADATGNFGRGSTQLGVRLGHTLRLGGQTDLDLYGEFGASNVSAGGDTFMSSDPGVSAWIPYLGTRLGLSYLTGNRHAPVVARVGLSVFGRVDLEGARSESVNWQESCWFSDCSIDKSASHTIGGDVTLGGLFTIGIDFGG